MGSNTFLSNQGHGVLSDPYRLSSWLELNPNWGPIISHPNSSCLSQALRKPSSQVVISSSEVGRNSNNQYSSARAVIRTWIGFPSESNSLALSREKCSCALIFDNKCLPKRWYGHLCTIMNEYASLPTPKTRVPQVLFNSCCPLDRGSFWRNLTFKLQ